MACSSDCLAVIARFPACPVRPHSSETNHENLCVTLRCRCDHLVGTVVYAGPAGAATDAARRFSGCGETFRDPMRQGVAWFRAGEFEKAEQAFARLATPEAEFNRGNCLIMRGKYEAAIERFDRALELRPGWTDAQANREIAVARAKLTKQKGGDMGDQKIGADDIVFDKNKKSGGQETETEDCPAPLRFGDASVMAPPRADQAS